MKNKWLLIGISVLALAVLVVGGIVWVGTAYAQSRNPGTPAYPYGMMGGQYGGYGMMGGYGYGPMHQYMVEALAEALNLNPEDLQARIDAGETPWQIAQSQGLSDEQAQEVMEEAHDEALDKAVEDGLLTKEQADWMDEHMESMWSGDYNGFGGCHDNYPPDGSSDSGTRFGPMMGWND